MGTGQAERSPWPALGGAISSEVVPRPWGRLSPLVGAFSSVRAKGRVSIVRSAPWSLQAGGCAVDAATQALDLTSFVEAREGGVDLVGGDLGMLALNSSTNNVGLTRIRE